MRDTPTPRTLPRARLQARAAGIVVAVSVAGAAALVAVYAAVWARKHASELRVSGMQVGADEHCALLRSVRLWWRFTYLMNRKDGACELCTKGPE